MKQHTICVHGVAPKRNSAGAISVPIYQTATFAHPGVGQSSGYDYTRQQNPTRESLEKTIAGLEEGCDALAFSSGMAAISAVMELFAPGDHLICSDDLYGGSRRLFEHIAAKNGLHFDFIDTAEPAAVKKLINSHTKAIYIETPTNPLMQITDIAAICHIAKQRHLLTIVDNTFLTPYFQKPLRLGADIVVHSGTKYLGGHNDTLAGFLAVASAPLAEKLRFIYKTTGACLAPFDRWLLIRGIKTLALRLDRQQQNALKIARWLETQPAVNKVYYAGLPTHPGHEISCKQASGYGAMISFHVAAKEIAHSLLDNVHIIQYAESLGGVESLITYPLLLTHADLPKEVREAKGIDETLLRLSVGIEDAGDLIADLTQALDKN